MAGSSLPRRTPLRSYTPLGRHTGFTAGTGLTVRTALARRGPVRPVSARRAAENRERKRMVAAKFPGALDGGQDRPLCAVWQARLTIGLPPLPVCARWSDDCHEPLSRARGGPITDPANATAPCRPCHDVLSITPESQLGWARRLGLVKGRKWGGDGISPGAPAGGVA